MLELWLQASAGNITQKMNLHPVQISRGHLSYGVVV